MQRFRQASRRAVLIGSFLIGLPVFFDAAFIILAPIIRNPAKKSKKSILYFGLPVAAAIPVTHGLAPPHPAPAAAAGADIGKTVVYGIPVSIPMVLVSGMLFRPYPATLRRWPWWPWLVAALFSPT